MFQGSLPALVTPFSGGAVDFDALERLVDWHVEQGSDGLVPVGTTGESPTLSHEEHEAVVEAVVARAAGRVPVIAGAGSNNTLEALRFVEHARDVGADAALVVTPYYNRPTQRGMIAHFEALAEIGLPLVIYNIPPRSAVDLLPKAMGRLARLDAVVGVKDATGDLARVLWTREACGADFVQLSGEDATAVGFNAQGGRGCITVTGNVAPALCAEQQRACMTGDYARALVLQDRLAPLHRALFLEPGVAGAKHAMARLGLIEEEVRLPLQTVTEETGRRIDAALRHAGLLN